MDIQVDRMEGVSGVTRTIIDERHSWDIEGDLIEGEGGDTLSIIDQLHSADRVKWKIKVALLEVSLTNFILHISKDIKWKV